LSHTGAAATTGAVLHDQHQGELVMGAAASIPATERSKSAGATKDVSIITNTWVKARNGE